MKKLKLNLDDIKVESFEVSNERKRQGTIIGALPCEDTGDGSCGTGGGAQSNEPKCSDVFCTQGPQCPSGHTFPSCDFTCFTCYTNCATCETHCGTCDPTCPGTCLVWNCA